MKTFDFGNADFPLKHFGQLSGSSGSASAVESPSVFVTLNSVDTESRSVSSACFERQGSLVATQLGSRRTLNAASIINILCTLKKYSFKENPDHHYTYTLGHSLETTRGKRKQQRCIVSR